MRIMMRCIVLKWVPFLKIGIGVNARVNDWSRSETVRVEAIHSNRIIIDT